MNKCFLLLGTNLGNRKKNLDTARYKIGIKIGEIFAESSVYESEPWGFHHDNTFLNQAIGCTTILQPSELIITLLSIEESLGRKRSSQEFDARTIDIDILFYNSKIIDEPGLIIPHPYLHVRNFVLTSLSEIARDFVHPLLNKTIEELNQECKDTCWVRKYNE